MSNTKYLPYPVDALPDSIRRAVLEHCSNNLTPPALAAIAALTAVSIAFQGGHNVRRPGGDPRPLHLFFMAIAQPSERKTSVMRDFCHPIRAFQELHDQSNRDARAGYASDERAWKAKERRLNSQISSEYAKGNPIEDLEARRRILNQERPKIPFIVRQIYEDVTFASLIQGLYQDCPHAALLSSEGTIVFKNLRIEDCGKLCAISDGDPLEFSRKDRNFSLRDVRLTVCIMTQIDSFRKFLEKGDGAIQEMGFLARMLVACPESQIGSRYIDNSVKSSVFFDKFNAKIFSVLAHRFSDHKNLYDAFETLELSEEAATIYRNFFNAIEGNFSESGTLYDVRDHASKIPEMALRMAALFHLMEERKGEIQSDLMDSAIKICTWHLFEYQRLFGKSSQISREFAGKELLLKWFPVRIAQHGFQPFKKMMPIAISLRHFGEKVWWIQFWKSCVEII
jgi:putative DNA primase/helicase